MARAFAGGTDQIIVSSGSVTNFGAVGYTLGFIVRFATVAAHALFRTTSDAVLCNPYSDGNVYLSMNGAFVSAPYSAGWQAMFITKASGTATPRLHVYTYSSDSWSHTNFSGTLNLSANSSSSHYLGSLNDGSNTLNGDLAIVGTWSRDMTDAEVESYGMQFSLQGWYAAAPTGLWLLDQASTSDTVVELTGGGGNQTGITGTSVSTQSVPSFNYGAGIEAPRSAAAGAGPSSVTLTPVVLTLAPVSVTPTPGPTQITLTPATLTLSAQAVSPVGGPASVTLTPAVLTLTARPVTLTVTVALTPATVTLAVVAVVPESLNGQATLQPATLALTAVPLTVVPGPVSVTLTPVLMSLVATVVLPARPGDPGLTLVLSGGRVSSPSISGGRVR